MTPELNTGSPMETPDGGAPKAETSQPAIKYLYEENRKMRNRLDKFEQEQEARERRLGRVEELMDKFSRFLYSFDKFSQSVSSLFERKGVNLAEEHPGGIKKTTQEGYLGERPEMDMEEYKAQLEAQGLSPQEIVQRMSRFEGAVPFEGGVNLDPEHQSTTPQEEISFEEYTQHRPSMDDFAKEKIQEAGGVTPEAAREVSAARQRVQDSEARMQPSEREEPSGFEKTKAQAKQTMQQAFQREGVNLDEENQLPQQERTTGQLIDQAQAEGTASGRTAQEVLDLSERMSPTSQPQQPEVAPTPA